MTIIVAGGSGFLGKPLVARLTADGHDVVVLTRRTRVANAARVRFVEWTPDGAVGPWAAEIDGANAVINLAGEGIADRRWTPARKDALRDSRAASTRSLVTAIRAASARPAVFLSGSAIGFYGATGDEILDESFPPGEDFLASLCVGWEAEAHAAEALGCRVVVIRTGIVLARDGGALKKLIPPFQLFAGGPIASGKQYMSWIHRDDWIALVIWALRTPAASGVFNATAPHPATNAAFMRTLGRALHRPSWLPMPRVALRVIVGEMADIALVGGQRVVPMRAEGLDFRFQYPDLDGAMVAAVRKTA